MDRLLCLLVCLIAHFSRYAKPLSRLGLGAYDERTDGQKLKILLVGYNGARNTGSDVRVVAIARQLADLFGPERAQISVMTMDAASLEGYFDESVSLLPFSSLFPWDLYRACCTHHAAVLCEGSTLKSTFANALTLFLCEAAGVMAGQRKPCIAYGSEVGYMEPFLERAAARLCRNTYFITRTGESFQRMKKLGLHGHTGTDAAWSYDRALSPAEAEGLLRAQGWDGKKPLLGVAAIDPFCWPVRPSLLRWVKSAVSGDRSGQYDKWYFFSVSRARQEAFRQYIRELASAVNTLARQRDFFPVLIGMERLDERACRALRERLDCPGAMFLSGDCAADAMTGVLRRLSALVTSRYHAAVLSMERACPIVAVSMDERLDDLMKEFSLDEAYLLHVTDRELGGRIASALLKALNRQEDIGRHIRLQTHANQAMLEDMGVYMKRYLLQN